MISLNNIKYSYNNIKVLDNYSLKIKLFEYVGGVFKSPYFLNNKLYLNKNKDQ